MEEYIVSARKYRPMTFDTVVGQAALTTTLKNAVKSGKLAHAYLFCGPRGVGKTTCARIFAKTINCMNPTSEGEACNECESCKSFNEQRSYNIFELDAASNNSVENIKALMEQTRIAPQIGRYKVFIIDEVHMLSTAAFNAFLKTLEEPPAHVIFILATTEKHKILPTIISRCQIYDFERMTVPAIVNHLKSVAEREGITVEDQALHMIAEKADGGMRDALSIFDQAASFSQGNITYQKVLEDLNILDNEYYFQIVDLAIGNKVPDIMMLFNSILSKGFDGGLLINGLASHIRNVLMAKDPATTSLLEVSQQQQERYRQQATQCPTPFLYKALKLLNQCDINYRTSSNKRLLAEITLIQVAQITQPDEEGDSAGRSPRRLKSLFQKMAATQLKAARQVTAAGSHASQQPKATPCATAAPMPSAQPSTATPAPQPAKPKPRIRLNSIGDTFDVLLNGERKTQQAQQPADEPAAPPTSANQPFTEDEVAHEWILMCNRMPQNMLGLATRMKNVLPKITEYPNIEVVIDNDILHGQILPIKGRIEKTLQNALHHADIHLTLRVAAPEEIKRIPTKREVLAEMLKENKAISKLCQALDLQMA
ncbi:MAG: DNA polymerase III subunit gamma/tau [Bacteroidales bacterium]|nr:DNA polymerase III subunit gamma/tau [Bacteroidales bacterium]